MPSVSRGVSVSSHSSAQKPSEQQTTSPPIVDRPRVVRPAKIHPTHPDQHSDPNTNAANPTLNTWHQSATAIPPHQSVDQNPNLHMPMNSSMQNAAQSLNIPKSAPLSQNLPGNQSPAKHMQTSQSQQNPQPAPQPQTHSHASPPAPHPGQQQPFPQPQGQPQPLLSQQPPQSHQMHSAPQLQMFHNQHHSLGGRPMQRTYLNRRDTPHHDAHKQQPISQQQVSQSVQAHISTQVQNQTPQQPPNISAGQISPQQMVSQQQMAAQQRLVSQQQMSQQQHVQQHMLQAQQQEQAQQYAQAQRMQQVQQQQRSLQISKQRAQPTFNTMQGRDVKPQFTQVSNTDPNISATVKSEYSRRYVHKPVHHMPNATSKKETEVRTTDAPQVRVHVQDQNQIAQQQQQVGLSDLSSGLSLPNSVQSLTTPNLSANVHVGNINPQTGQLYQVGMVVPTGTVPVSGSGTIQYAAAPYTNAAIFDPLALNQSGIQMNVAMGQTVPSQGVAVVREVDRKAQHPQMQVRQGVQRTERNGVITRDLQGFVEQGHQQVVHRTAMQGPGQHDLQGHPVGQHALGSGLYQHVDQQHGVNNPNASLAQQQGQVVVSNQAGHMPQHGQMQSQDGHFEQQVYSNVHQNPVTASVTTGLHQSKGINPSAQQELLVWSTANPNARILPPGISQQANGEVAHVAAAPGTLITQSPMFDMGQNSQSGMAQMAQQVAMQKSQQPSQNLMPVRSLPSNDVNPSPRKRRQLTPSTNVAVNPVGSGKMFTCSGCTIRFSRKRDRDTHVRTVHERSFSCTQCQARFKTKSDANRHIRIVHDRVRPYQCPSCPSMFSERNKLRRHKETVHEKLRPYVCPVCSARFGELGNLRQHTGSLHPDYQVESATGRTRVNNQVQS